MRRRVYLFQSMSTARLQFVHRKAFFHYEIIQKYTAGIVLDGPEVKAIRSGKVNLNGAYGSFIQGELWAKEIHIGHYHAAPAYTKDPLRMRKLLLKRRELTKIHRCVEQKNNTVVILRIFINHKNLIKAEIAVARGKKLYDKRESIKKRDLERKKHS